MSNPARFLTRNDRANRRDNIRRAIAKGMPTRDVAARYGVSIRWVREIAADAGLQRATGKRQA